MSHWTPTVDGIVVPSVTTILEVMDKKWLRPWYAKEELSRCIKELATDNPLTTQELKSLLALWRRRLREKTYAAEQKAGEAGSVGTDFHSAVEIILKEGLRPTVRDAVAPLVSRWCEWRDQFNPQPVGLEQHVVSRKWMYGGTFDFIGTTLYNCTPNGLTIADWKTSNKIDDTFGLQLAAYAYAYGEQQGWTEEQTWERIKVGISVRIDKREWKEHELEFKVYNDLPYLFRVFTQLREPYDFLRQVGIWEAELEPQEA